MLSFGASSPWCRSSLLREFGARRRRVSLATFLITQPPERTLDQSGQLICSTVDGLVQGRGPVSDRDGRAAFEASLHHAPHVVIAALLVAVLVAQVDLHSRDVIADSAQGILHYATDLSTQRLVTCDVTVGIDLDLHGFSA